MYTYFLLAKDCALSNEEKCILKVIGSATAGYNVRKFPFKIEYMFYLFWLIAFIKEYFKAMSH